MLSGIFGAPGIGQGHCRAPLILRTPSLHALRKDPHKYPDVATNNCAALLRLDGYQTYTLISVVFEKEINSNLDYYFF